mgnify:CR=1 FL=1
MKIIRQDYGDGRFFEFGVLRKPEQDEHFYLLIGFPDDKEPMRMLLEPQDIWHIRNFLERAQWEVINPMLRKEKKLTENGNIILRICNPLEDEKGEEKCE